MSREDSVTLNSLEPEKHDKFDMVIDLDSNPSKLINFLVLTLDLCALIIHIDLYMVTKYKRHLFTPILEWKLISQKQLSPYATAYRNSL